METGLTKQKLISELTKSPHGKLHEYIPIGQQAATQEPEFLAHLISWNRLRGQIRDSKTALPVIHLSTPNYVPAFVENAIAHLASLDPRNLVKALRFAKEIKTPGKGREIRRMVERYLKARENKIGWWDKTAMQHRGSLKELYALFHVSPSMRAQAVLFNRLYPKGSPFEVVANIKNMSAIEAAGQIVKHKIPFLVATGALGERAKDPDLVLALIQRMTPSELVNNMKRLERLGVKTVPALRSALEDALGKAAGSKKNVLKASVAAKAVGDEKLKAKLQGLQEKQLQSIGMEGDWLVLADKSGSMQSAIEAARHVAATLARAAKGKVHLIFFDTLPRHVDATGKTYDELQAETQHVTAGGGTSIGCGLQWALGRKEVVDGIAIVSDGGENNNPHFADVYKRYSQVVDKEVPVYLYRCPGDPNTLEFRCNVAGIDLHTFDLSGGVDYYSIPNLVATMRTNRYSLIDEIMATPLLTVGEVLGVELEEAEVTA